MISIESQVYTAVNNALTAAFPGIYVESDTTYKPSRFPTVCIEEIDSYTHPETMDSSSQENHANVMYEVNIYSNKRSGKKAECKAISAVIDDVLISKGFIRNMKQPIDTGDASYYRLFVRYSALVSKENVIYRG